MDDKPILVMITTPSKEIGKQIADVLLAEKLAACVNIISPINSLYTWKGEINDDEESLLIVKSRESLFAEGLVPAVRTIHPYEVPEIIALPIISGLDDYLDWIAESTQSGSA
jgi:periplasmic divalent cation tolerance protein